MQKKLGVRILVVMMVLLFSGSMAVTASAAVITPNASDYLTYYSADIDSSTGSQIIIYYEVNATRVMDLVGVYYLVVEEYSGGTWNSVASCFGSTGNGLLAADTDSHVGSITYPGTTGKQYRALVTVYAEDSTGSDSRTVTTNSVTAG